MKTRRFLDSRIGYSLASLGMLLGIVAPTMVPAFASAAQLSSRGIQMSTSAANASGANYTVSFTPSAAFKAVVIDWCAESPVVGAGSGTCTTPTAFDASSATAAFTTNSIGTITPTGTAGHTVLTGTTSAAVSAVVFTLTGVHNPSTTGTFYARIYTYTTNASTYTATDDLGSTVDTGGIALSTANTVGVTAAVRESLTFCVSHTAPLANCASTDAPSLTLGEGTGANLALASTAVSTGIDYAQVSTNAAGGAVVNLTNSNDCGGLRRNISGVTACDIAPQTASGISAGNALFGLKLGTPAAATDAGGAANGTIAPVAGYSDYFMDYHAGGATGVTSAYGSKLFDTSSAPINDQNIPMTFGASISNETPAGLYTATLNLIATSTY